MSSPNPKRHERISELVTQLTGAPLERSRSVVAESSERHGAADTLWNVADALIAIRTAA